MGGSTSKTASSIEMETRRPGRDEETLKLIHGISNRPPPAPERTSESVFTGSKKKAVSLMEMAESDAVSKYNTKSRTLAEMYGM